MTALRSTGRESRFPRLRWAVGWLLLALALPSLGASMGAAEAGGAPVSLESPLAGQVFQRQSERRGVVVVRGHVAPGVNRLELTLVPATPGARAIRRRLEWRPAALRRPFEERLRVPAGGGYRCEVRVWEAGRREAVSRVVVENVGVGDVFVIAGQSNSANHGSERQRVAGGGVMAFDGKEWRVAHDPQPGASGTGGSFVPAFGEALMRRTGVPVGVICVGAGGTSVREWLPRGDRMNQQPTTGANVRQVDATTWEATGELFERLMRPLQQLGPRGCRAVLWHQGESDAGQARSGYPADRQITGAQYVAFMERLVTASRARAGWSVPWITAQTTYHSEADPADAEFRAAQAELWRRGVTLRGPDTDALRAGLRDGVHFNALGLRRHGEAWAGCVLEVTTARNR